MADPCKKSRPFLCVQVMTSFTVSGMTCAGCAKKVENTLHALAPSATVTLNPPRVQMAEAVPLAQLNAALSKIGNYSVAVDVPVAETFVDPAPSGWLQTYYPLLLVIGLIAVASAAGPDWMGNFMAGFFIVFGAFKLLDVPGFADAYARYDVIAKRFKLWGFAYPFVETVLGLAFLFHVQPKVTLWAALIVSLVGAVGVIQTNLRKQTIQCACLGAVIKLPMSVVTIVESLGMAAMAIWMLFTR